MERSLLRFNRYPPTAHTKRLFVKAWIFTVQPQQLRYCFLSEVYFFCFSTIPALDRLCFIGENPRHDWILMIDNWPVKTYLNRFRYLSGMFQIRFGHFRQVSDRFQTDRYQKENVSLLIPTWLFSQPSVPKHPRRTVRKFPFPFYLSYVQSYAQF